MSGHEHLRLEVLRKRILELGAADEVFYDEFGSLTWIVHGSEEEGPITNIWFDGHSDTVDPLPEKWLELAGVDAFHGRSRDHPINEAFLLNELDFIPDKSEWSHLVFGRGAADQLAGVVTQVFATKILRELGLLKNVRVRSIATISEEDNDGGSPLSLLSLSPIPQNQWPDVVVLTEATGDTKKGTLGLYRGQRGRCTLRLVCVGKSCHGSMPQCGLNPLEWSARIVAEAEQQARNGATFKKHEFLGAGTRTASWGLVTTPSDCAVPQECQIKFDRRLTIGETPEQAIAELESLPSVAQARAG